MSTPLIIHNSITINVSIDKVWNALTNPAETKKYMFGCETVSDWKPRSPLLWKGSYEGKEMIFVKGIIVEMNPPHLLIYTVLDPNGTIEDIPENYLTVTYHLIENHNQTILTVSQGDYSMVADGEKRFAEASNKGEGWNSILFEIKKILECE